MQACIRYLFIYAERPWNESLSARIAEVQDCYKNIPSKLYFSPSSVSFEGIGVYAAEPLPQGIASNTIHINCYELGRVVSMPIISLLTACTAIIINEISHLNQIFGYFIMYTKLRQSDNLIYLCIF